MGPPLIFETMVFIQEGLNEQYCLSVTSTEEEALKGHEKVKKRYAKKSIPTHS